MIASTYKQRHCDIYRAEIISQLFETMHWMVLAMLWKALFAIKVELIFCL